MKKIEIGFVKFRNKLNQVFPHSRKKLFSSAIITAAGSGARMGNVSKQLINLNGIPCVAYSLLAFQECKEIDEIVVVAKKEEVELIRELCQRYGISKMKDVVSGGNTRQESVQNGFFRISKHADLVAIHDGARPLIQPTQISLLLKAASRWGASCAAKKVSDTVKRAKKNDFIKETVSRDDLYTVQTPQVFKTDLYRVSLALAEKDHFLVTDDTSLAEHAGFAVKLVDLKSQNLKITVPEDLNEILALLKEREHD